MHPLVGKVRDKFLADAQARGAPVVVLDVPLLFETGGEHGCDAVVVVSARAQPSEVDSLLRAGAQDYVVKPVRSDELEARLVAAHRVAVEHRRLIVSEARYRRLAMKVTPAARPDFPPSPDLAAR